MLNACGAVRPNKYYQLTVPDDRMSGAARAFPVTLVLGPITSSELYREDQIVYTSDGLAMGQYQYHRWAEPPPEMIHDVLLRKLQLSGHYQQVYSLLSDVRGDYLLRGRLYDFREIDGDRLMARVAFEFELYDSETGMIVWKHYYSHDEPVVGKDVTHSRAKSHEMAYRFPMFFPLRNRISTSCYSGFKDNPTCACATIRLNG